MNGKKWFILLVGLATIFLASSVGVTKSSFFDTESSSDTFQAWASNLWRQTDKAHFDAGVLTNVDTSSSSGDVKLSTITGTQYSASGTIASQVLDTGIAGTRWNALFWDRTLETGTSITFEVRASDTLFAKDTPPVTLPWISVGGTSPVTSGLPSGRYMQWQATLTTADTSKTPILHEVRVYYY